MALKRAGVEIRYNRYAAGLAVSRSTSQKTNYIACTAATEK